MDNPEFYKDFNPSEIKEFEQILNLIHRDEPNIELAKQKVLGFSDNDKVDRFRNFKKQYENALKASSSAINSNSYTKDNTGKRYSELTQHKEHLINSGVKRARTELKSHVLKNEKPSKKPKY